MARVLIPLATGVEELEAVTLIDLLRRAGITVITASLAEQRQISASRGVQLIADTTLDAVLHDNFDMIILPGGMAGSNQLNDDPRIHAIIKKLHSSKKAIGAICAAPMVLAHSGLLAGKTVTCYPGVLSKQDWPEISLSDQAVVIDDKLITSQGPGTAMDFALTVIEFLTDQTTRNTVEKDLIRPSS